MEGKKGKKKNLNGDHFMPLRILGGQRQKETQTSLTIHREFTSHVTGKSSGGVGFSHGWIPEPLGSRERTSH